MKLLLIASAALLSVALYAQDTAMANVDSANGTIVNYRLSELVVSGDTPDVLLGELNSKKSRKGQTISADSKVAYYFENTTREDGVYLKSMLFKVAKVKHKTEARIKIYKKHDYVQDTYHPKTGAKFSYATFIPGDPIATQEIIVFLEPGQKGVVEVDLTEYGIIMPEEGLFLSLEGVGYYDAAGKPMKITDRKEMTWIDFHPTATNNYCAWINSAGTNSYFWNNINKHLKVDYEVVFEHKPSKKTIMAPNFGLKVIMPKLKF